jgi:membrane protein required for colicin V production
MDHFGFTWFDLVALAVIALSGIMAFARGLIREIFSIIAFIGAAIAAVFFAEMLRPLVESVSSLRGALASVAAGLAIFLVVFIIITIVTSMVAKTAHQSTEIGSFDRAAGLAFGILRGVLVVSLFVLLMRQTTGDATISPQAAMPEAIAGARTYPIYEAVAKALEHVLPQARQRAHDIIERHEHPESDGVATTEPVPPATPTATATTAGSTHH